MNNMIFFYHNEAISDDALGGAISAGSVLASSEPAQPNHFLPEKYQVLKEDGSLDLEQSSKKTIRGVTAT